MLSLSIIEQGLIFSLIALGVYITYKILDFPDLSVDGSIVLGASVTALLITKDYNPIIATIVALLCGGISGIVTGILHVHLKITNLLSGILVMIGLYSINLRIMGKPNIQFFNYKTIFSNQSKIIVILLIVVIVKIIIDLFLKTKMGLLLKITGDNEVLVTSLGESIGKMKIIGLMISNAIVALGGSLLSQYQRFTDINFGTGTIVVGLASVIVGEKIFKFGKNYLKVTSMVIFGAILYKATQAYTLQIGLAANDFKLVTAIILVIALSFNNIKINKKLKIKVKNLSKLSFKRGEARC